MTKSKRQNIPGDHLDQLRDKYIKAINKINKKFGYEGTIKFNRMVYSTNDEKTLDSYSMNFDFQKTMTDQYQKEIQSHWNQKALTSGLLAEDLGKTFKINGKTMKITGWDSDRTKHKVVVKCLENKKSSCWPSEDIIKILRPVPNLCEICNKPITNYGSWCKVHPYCFKDGVNGTQKRELLTHYHCEKCEKYSTSKECPCFKQNQSIQNDVKTIKIKQEPVIKIE